MRCSCRNSLFGKQDVHRGRERAPNLCRMRELVFAGFVERVVLAVRTLVAWHYIGGQRAGGVETAKRAIDRGVADVFEAGGSQPSQDVVTVAVFLLQDGEHRDVQHSLQELCCIHGVNGTVYYTVVSRRDYTPASRGSRTAASPFSCSLT